MGKLSFKIDADWSKVQKLREEIAKLKQEIKGTDAVQSPHAFNTLNAKLVQTSQELGKVTGKIAQASAAMETDFKQKIYAASQGVNDFTEKIISQKAVVKDVAADVKRLGDAYRDAKKYSPMQAEGKLAEWKAAKRALEEERAALFGLTQEQATARLSVKRLNDEYKAFRQEGGGTAQTMDLLSSKMKGIAAAVMGGMGLKELAGHIISIRGQFESMETSLKVLLGGSQERLDKIMGQIKEYALASPLNTKDMVGAVQMMTSFGIEAEKSIDYLKAIGDISMGDTGKFNSLALAFSQMSAAGKLMGQDLLQMVNAGFNPLEEISRKTGKSIGELKEEMSKGAITSKMVQDAFISVTSAGGKFYGMAAEGAKTLNGQISMLQESFDNMFNEIGSKGEGVVMTAVQTATKLVENYEQVGKILAGLVVTYGTYKTALILSTQVTNGMTMAQVLHTTATKALTAAEAALNKTILANPYVLAAAALGTLITAVVLAGDSMTAAERAQDNYNKKIEENSKLVKDEKAEIDKLIGTLEDETSSIESKNIAFSTLIAKYPTIFGKYKTEKDLIDHLTEARQRENAEIERKTALLGQKSYKESKTRATELNRLKYLQENGDIKGRQTQSGYKKGKDQDEYLRLWNKYHDDIKKTQTWYGTENGAIDRLASVATEEYKLNINENRKAQIAKYNANIGNLSKVQAQKELVRLHSGLKQMDKSGKNYLKIGNNEPLSRVQIKERITLLENNVKTERKTMAQWRKEAEKETKKNRKAAKDLASSTELLTKDQAEKKMKAANDTLATSEKSEKNFDIQDKSGAKAAAKAERNRKQQIKDANAHQKAVNDLDSKKIAKSQAQIELENQVEQSRIDALHEGSEKTLAAMKLAHKKELEQIDKQKEDYLKKKQEEAEAEFKADPKNKNKTFNRSSVVLTKDEQAKFDTIRNNTLRKQSNEEKKEQQQQANALNAYLKEYGSIQEQRLAIANEYDEKIANANTYWEKQSLEEQKQAALKTFDFNQFKESINWEQVFGDLSTQATKTLEKLKGQLQDMLQNITNPTDIGTIAGKLNEINSQIRKNKNRIASAFGWDIPELDKIRQAEDEVKTYQKQLDTLKSQAIGYNNSIGLNKMSAMDLLKGRGINVSESDIKSENFDSLINKIGGNDSELGQKLSGIFSKLSSNESLLGKNTQTQTQVAGKLAGAQSAAAGGGGAAGFAITDAIIHGVNQNVQSTPMMLRELGVKENSGLYQGMTQFAESSQKATDAFDSMKRGDLAGVVGNLAGAFKSLGSSVTTWFGLDGNNRKRIKEWQDTVKKYESLDRVWDSLIAKKQKYLDMSWGKEYEGTTEEIKALQQAEIKGTQETAAKWLRTKAKHHAASHTQTTWQNRLFTNGDTKSKADNSVFDAIMQGLSSAGFTEDQNGNALKIEGVTDFFNLTSDELDYIKTHWATNWADMDEQMQDYLDDYQKGLDTMADSSKDAVDNIIGSMSDLIGALKELAADSDKDFGDVVDSFNKTVNDEIWESLTNKESEYYKRMEAYRKHWDEAEHDSTLTKEEEEALQKEYTSIYEDTKAAYNRKTAELGTNDINSSQKATANGISSITYEQANNIVALTRAGNITRDQAKDILTGKLSSIDVSIIGLQSLAKEHNSIADELRTIQANSYIELQGIHEDTSAMNKAIKSMSNDVSDIKKQIKDM